MRMQFPAPLATRSVRRGGIKRNPREPAAFLDILGADHSILFSFSHEVSDPPLARPSQQFGKACRKRSDGEVMKPRVLQIISHVGLGGSEDVCFGIMRGLHSQFEFEVFAFSGIAKDCPVARKHLQTARALGVPIHSGTRVPQRLGGMIPSGIALARVLKRVRPDLIHVHTEKPEAAYAVAVSVRPSIRRIPLVRTVHSTKLWSNWMTIGRWCDSRMSHASVACVSEAARAAFIAVHNPARAPDVIHNGVAMEVASPCPCADKNRLRMLFAARLEDNKGAHLLPEIVRTAQPPSGCVYDLSIHGSGKHRRRLEVLASDPPRGWRIRIDGPFAQLADALRDFDLVLMPSLFEGLGLTAVEALLAGVPVVGTAVPGLREVVGPAYPWLAAPGDARSFATVLDRAIAERARWPQVVRAEADRARRQFDVSAMCRAYANLYANAAAGAAGGRTTNIGSLPANELTTQAFR
jgi:glycosyltransferase involved in cell wall biosynthesis